MAPSVSGFGSFSSVGVTLAVIGFFVLAVPVETYIGSSSSDVHVSSSSAFQERSFEYPDSCFKTHQAGQGSFDFSFHVPPAAAPCDMSGCGSAVIVYHENIYNLLHVPANVKNFVATMQSEGDDVTLYLYDEHAEKYIVHWTMGLVHSSGFVNSSYRRSVLSAAYKNMRISYKTSGSSVLSIHGVTPYDLLLQVGNRGADVANARLHCTYDALKACDPSKLTPHATLSPLLGREPAPSSASSPTHPSHAFLARTPARPTQKSNAGGGSSAHVQATASVEASREEDKKTRRPSPTPSPMLHPQPEPSRNQRKHQNAAGGSSTKSNKVSLLTRDKSADSSREQHERPKTGSAIENNGRKHSNSFAPQATPRPKQLLTQTKKRRNYLSPAPALQPTLRRTHQPSQVSKPMPERASPGTSIPRWFWIFVLGICVSILMCYSKTRQSLQQQEQRDMQLTANKEREYAAIPVDQEQNTVEHDSKQQAQEELLGKWKVVHDEGIVYYDSWTDEHFTGTFEKDEILLLTKVEHDGKNPYGFVAGKGWIPISASSWNERTRRLGDDEARQDEAEQKIAQEKKRAEEAEEAEKKAEEERLNKLAQEAAIKQDAWKRKEADKKREEEEARRKLEDMNTCKFTIILKKSESNARWEFKTMYSPDFQQISFMEPVGAPMEEWHKANPTKLVRFGDEILSCNGKSGDAKAFFSAMSESNVLEIVLRRKLEIEVTAITPLGLRFKKMGSAEIVDIKGGGIMNYNEVCPPRVAIGPGDVLQKVNGKSEGLLQEIERAGEKATVKLVFTRPPVN